VDSNYIQNSSVLHIYYTVLTIRDTLSLGKSPEHVYLNFLVSYSMVYMKQKMYIFTKTEN
jgi:hypothetical protein